VDQILKAIGIRWELVLIQFLGFLIIFAILKSLLFDRVRAFMAARAAEEASERHELDRERKARAEAVARLEARLAEIEKQAYEATQAEVRSGLKRKTDIVQEAHERAHGELERSRSKLEAERAAALGRIEADIVDLAIFLAGQTMGRKLDEPRYAEIARREVAARGGRPTS
jgi:F0F1-type ATP synthase membrane subunit b/b'